MQEEKFHRESVEGVDAVFERMWEAVGRPLFTGYAQAFDVSENDIKNWRRRGRVSRAYLEGFSREHGVSLDWLLHGEAAPLQVRQDVLPYGLSADEVALLETYRDIDQEARATLQNLLKIIATAGHAKAAPKAKTRQPVHGGAVEPVRAGSHGTARPKGKGRTQTDSQ